MTAPRPLAPLLARSLAVLLVSLVARPSPLRAADAEALPVAVAPDDAKLHYVGRFDTADAKGPRCAWPASGVTLRFRGGALNARLASSGNSDRWQVVLDGKPAAVLKLTSTPTLYRVADGLGDGEHTVALVKRTEAFCGTSQISGFQLPADGALLPVPPAGLRLEVIGDSISCGYGNEGASQNEHFSADTENAWLAYGAVAAREVGADYVCVAWSGRKMWPNNTVPEVYDRTLPQDPKSRWDFARWLPDVVVINLATNDFGGGNPEEEGWVRAYEAFVKHVRGNYPSALIYCSLGSMMSDSYPQGKKALSTARRYIQRVVKESNDAGDAKVKFIEFEPQRMENGLGSDWHPSVKTDRLMGEKLAAAIREDLNLKPAKPVGSGH